MISLKTILRSLRRNGLYSVINIAGLVIGMTASALIFLWVFHERSFDRYHPDSERIYLVLNTLNAGNENQKLGMFSPSLLAMVAKENIPEIENTAELSGCNITGIKVNNEIFPVSDQVAYVDKEWFELFEYQLLEGSFTAFGNHPYSIVLTESNARKFFGNAMAIGQTIGINETDYTVQAVVKDNLANSSFQSGILIAKDAFPVMTFYRDNWLDIQWVTFVKLRIDADVSAVSQKINDLYGGTVIKQSFTLRPLTDIHFQTDISNSSSLFVSGNKKIVSIFSMLGILLLLTACINYVNLTTARANMRTKEVGVRKIVGAKRRTLFLQFVAESFVICSIAVVMSLFLNWMLRPVHHVLAGNTVFSFSSPVLWVVIGVILLITTLLNGIYPALMLSSFRPTNLMRGIGLLKIKSGNLRKGLVVFQFTLSTILIISVITIFKQMQYIHRLNPGYNREQVVSLTTHAKAIKIIDGSASRIELSMQNLKTELQSQTGIVSVALCSDMIINGSFGTYGVIDWDGRAGDFKPMITLMGVDAGYKQTLGLELVEGRWFEEGNKADESGFILNETAIREFNLHEPYIGQRFDMGITKGRIIGIVKDFHYKSLHEKIGPLVFTNKWHNILTFKTQAGQSTQAIQTAKKIWTTIFPNDPFEYVFLDDAFNNLYKSDIRTSQLMLIFSILAIVIAVLGLFGLSTFSIERRTKEIGIRKVFGASALNIVHLLTREFLILVTISFAIATPLSWWAMSRWLENYAYHIPVTIRIFIVGSAVIVIFAIIAVGVQAVKAATANPANSIKNE